MVKKVKINEVPEKRIQTNMIGYSRSSSEDANGKTHFDRLADNPEETIKMWLDQGYEEIDIENILDYFKNGEKFLQTNGFHGIKYKPNKRTKFRYIRTDGKVRMGGVIMYVAQDEEENYYIVFLNVALKRLFSVQLADVDTLYLADVNIKKKMTEDECLEIISRLNIQKYNNAYKLWGYVKTKRQEDPDFCKGLTKRYISDYFKNVVKDD